MKYHKTVRFEVPSQVRFLTFSCDGRRNYLSSIWAKDIFVEQLALSKNLLDFRLYAWVVLPNHVHLLVQPNLEIAAVPRILTGLKTRSAERILPRLRLENGAGNQSVDRLWLQGGGYDRNVADGDELLEKLNYIECNPVKARYCKLPEEYKWSSAGSEILPRDPIWY